MPLMSDQLWRTEEIVVSFCMLRYVSGTYESKCLVAAAEFGTVASADEGWVITSESRLRIDLPGITIQLVAAVA
jgi:hypothetical protein